MRSLLALLLLLLPATADTAVWVHGTLLTGDLRVDGDEVVRVSGEREQRYPRRDFLLVEKDDGTLLWAADLETRLRGYEYLAREKKRKLLVTLCEKALNARDRDLSRNLLDEAEANGFTGKKAETLKRRLQRLEKGATSRDAAKAKQVSARAAEVAAVHPDLLAQRARRALQGGTDGLRLLREALRQDPLHDGASKLLAERAPRDFPLGSRTFWLDWHLDLESTGAKLVAGEQEDLKRARRQWRGDLYGIEAGPIRLLTTVQDTGTVGRCLAYGRLVCNVLEEMFRTEKPRPRHSQALLVFLYASRQEYESNSGTGRPVEDRDRGFLKDTAGHYTPIERLSRVIWHTDPDAERRIARVFMHELTHHWVTELNPRYSNAELRLRGTPPGYWVVEGLATFIEEGRYDVETGAYELFDSRSSSLDTVHVLGQKGKLLPWDSVYALSLRTFRALPRDHTIKLVRRWQVGEWGLTPARLFYEQATATVHFLYHGENGRYRKQLLDFVTHYYTGKKDKLTIEAAFQMKPLELGKRVEAFANQVAAGWRP
ncbi:MAG: hypothetical protein ACYTG3_18195 [Planctomycetota bacterium]|jgi:hypothetical protein